MPETDREQKIWQEIIEDIKRSSPQKLPGEMTLTDLCQFTGLKRDYVRSRLNELVAAGKLKVRITSKVKYYSLV